MQDLDLTHGVGIMDNGRDMGVSRKDVKRIKKILGMN